MIVTPKDAIRMCRGSLPNTQISKMLGKEQSYVGQVLSRRTVGAQVMIDILAVLGYETIVRDKASREEFVLTPSQDEMIVPHSLTISINDPALHDRMRTLMDDGTLETELHKLLVSDS